MAHLGPQALARQGVCSCSSATAQQHPHPRLPPASSVYASPQRGLPRLRATNTGQEYKDPQFATEEESGLVNLGQQYQVFKPEMGPLEKRVNTTWLDGLFEGEIDLEETDYWFTEPPGGWNAEVKYMPTAQEGPGNWFKAYVGGADEGRVRSRSSPPRVPLDAIKPGTVLKGKVHEHHINHGILVDIGGVYTGLLQVKFRPYDIKDNPYNAAIPANVVGMVKGNQGEDDEEVLQRLAEAEEDMEEDDGPLAKRDPWEKFGTRLHPDEEVTVRVHAVNTAPAARFPVQLELLEPADLKPWMMPVQHYKWAYDLRGLDTVEKIEAATGLTMGVRNLSEEELSEAELRHLINPSSRKRRKRRTKEQRVLAKEILAIEYDSVGAIAGG